jgi:aminopeptidase N
MGRMLARDTLVDMILNGAAPAADYLDALRAVFLDDTLDPAFRALTVGLPSADERAQVLFDMGETPDPQAIHDQRRALRDRLAAHLSSDLKPVFDAMDAGAFVPDAVGSGKRSLRLAALGLLSVLDGGDTARALFASADNMTEQAGALQALLNIGAGADELTAFENQWRHDRLVMDKWFMMQVISAAPDETAEVVNRLTAHPDFNMKNPNRFRAVFGGLGANAAGFHHASGSGYALMADWLIQLDALNPQTTARMSGAFETWRRYDADRQALIKAELTRILSTPNLSRDTTEMVQRMLG